jgi:hypothetical protein
VFYYKKKKKKHGATAERKKERTCIVEEGRKRKNNQNKFGVNKPNTKDKKVKQNQEKNHWLPFVFVLLCIHKRQWTIHRQRKCKSSRTDIRNVEQTKKILAREGKRNKKQQEKKNQIP